MMLPTSKQSKGIFEEKFLLKCSVRFLYSCTNIFQNSVGWGDLDPTPAKIHYEILMFPVVSCTVASTVVQTSPGMGPSSFAKWQGVSGEWVEKPHSHTQLRLHWPPFHKGYWYSNNFYHERLKCYRLKLHSSQVPVSAFARALLLLHLLPLHLLPTTSNVCAVSPVLANLLLVGFFGVCGDTSPF